MSRRRPGQRDEVTATELAEMGFCEMRVLLAHLHGEHTTTEQRKARARGLSAHQQYYEEGKASGDRRCFIATCVFGPDAAETQVLRAYRDAVLLPRPWGRWLVQIYYRTAPAVCSFLDRSPAAAAAVRALLRKLVDQCRSVVCEGSGP